MTTSLLLGACVCGEPMFRHRLPNGRQISCDQLRRIDEQLRQSSAQPVGEARGDRGDADRQFQIIAGGRERDQTIRRAVAEISLHGGER